MVRVRARWEEWVRVWIREEARSLTCPRPQWGLGREGSRPPHHVYLGHGVGGLSSPRPLAPRLRPSRSPLYCRSRRWGEELVRVRPGGRGVVRFRARGGGAVMVRVGGRTRSRLGLGLGLGLGGRD